MKTRRRPRFRIILGIVALFGTLISVAIAAEVARNERLLASYREQAAIHERESRHLAEGAVEAEKAAASLRTIAERNRDSAEACLQNADAESVAFARQLWRERAEEFRREAARVARRGRQVRPTGLRPRFPLRTAPPRPGSLPGRHRRRQPGVALMTRRLDLRMRTGTLLALITLFAGVLGLAVESHRLWRLSPARSPPRRRTRRSGPSRLPARRTGRGLGRFCEG